MFFIATNEGAKNFKLMRASLEDLDKAYWHEVIPHREDVLLEGLDSFEKHLVVYERKNGLKQIRVSAADGVSDVKYVSFPDPAYYFELEDNSAMRRTSCVLNILRLLRPTPLWTSIWTAAFGKQKRSMPSAASTKQIKPLSVSSPKRPSVLALWSN